tara:strand:+ start:68 stop:352 length:285 start_codon:yes stop_codon:yes gene_type:complete
MKFSKNKHMKIFIYKSLIIFFLFILGFKITFSYAQRTIDRKIDHLTSKEYIDTIKQKLRSEMKKAIEKKDLINNEDKDLLNNFINKIQKELRNN